jgi:hypothetical protein
VLAADLDMAQYRIGSASVKQKNGAHGLWKVVVKNNSNKKKKKKRSEPMTSLIIWVTNLNQPRTAIGTNY